MLRTLIYLIGYFQYEMDQKSILSQCNDCAVPVSFY